MQPDQEQKALTDNPVDMYQPSEVEENTQNSQNYQEQVEVDDQNLVHWSASEYISDEKNGMWFVAFAIITLGLIMADIFLIKSYTFSVLVAVMALAVVVLSRRPPRVINYTLSGQGLYIGEKLYHFNEFKSFGVISDNDRHSLMLIPIKRFSLGVTVYFPYEAGEKIVDLIGARLPMQVIKLDTIDTIVKKLRL